MIVLTDVPEQADSLVAPLAAAPPVWGPAGVGAASAGESRLWRRLGSGGEPVRSVILARPTACCWHTLVIAGGAATSQFDALRELAAERTGLPGRVACLTLGGESCHGQRRRSWQAAAGNLHLSVGCPTDLAAVECGLAMTALPAIAAVDAVAEVGSVSARARDLGIKWVNDILIGQAKVGGVLTATQSLAGRVVMVVFGIGLNVERAPVVPPTRFVPSVTCLQERSATAQVTLPILLAAVLPALEARLDEVARRGPGPLLAAYRGASRVVGRHVRIWPDPDPHHDRPDSPSKPLAEGVVRAVADDLSLSVAGYDAPISRGRLEFVDSCDGD